MFNLCNNNVEYCIMRDFEDEYDPEFERTPVWDQLGTILDSESAGEVVKKEKHHQITRVVTDDNVEFEVTPNQAVLIRRILTVTPVLRRRIMFRDLQCSKGFTVILNAAKILEEKQNDKS